MPQADANPFDIGIRGLHGIIVAGALPLLRAEEQLDGDLVTPAIDRFVQR